jgi:anaerobic selenocysteine-containing dehydrogenase
MTRRVVSTICDIGCQLQASARDGRLHRIHAHDVPMLAGNICMKGVAAPEIHNHPERLRVPLKRVGERGEDRNS